MVEVEDMLEAALLRINGTLFVDHHLRVVVVGNILRRIYYLRNVSQEDV